MEYTRQVVTRIAPPEDEYLRRRAAEENSSIARVIRCLVQEAIKSEQQPQDQHEVA